MNQNQHGIKDPWGGISYILQYTAVWVKTRGTLVVKDGQTVEKTHCKLGESPPPAVLAGLAGTEMRISPAPVSATEYTILKKRRAPKCHPLSTKQFKVEVTRH